MSQPLIFSAMAVAILFIGACGGPETGSAMDPDSKGESEPIAVDALIEEAQAAHQIAEQKQHGWIATVKLIDSARELLAAGDEPRARQVATRALETAHASVAQAENEALKWNARVPR